MFTLRSNSCLLLLFWINLSVFAVLNSISASVLFDPENNDKIAEFSYDFDTEQSKDRYDTRLLSKEIQEQESASFDDDDIIYDDNDDEEEDGTEGGEASCYTENSRKYRHGQKILRLDPCETCLCMDGEIFCWWKKCNNKKSIHENRKHNRKLSLHIKNQNLNKENHHKKKLKNSSIKRLSKHHSSSMRSIDLKVNGNETYYPTMINSLSSTSSSSEESVPLRGVINGMNNKHHTSSTVTVLPSKLNKFPKKVKNKNKGNENMKLSRTSSFRVKIKNNKENNKKFVNVATVDDDDNGFHEHQAQRTQIKTNNDDHLIEDIPLMKHYIITSSGRIENNKNDEDDDDNDNDEIRIHGNENILSQFENPYAVPSIDDDDDAIETSLNYKKKIKHIDTSINKESSNPLSFSMHSTINQWEQESNRNKNNEMKSVTLKTTTATAVPATTVDKQKIEEEHCIVMGKSYKIGTILPQDTGNCLQCICIEGDTKDEPPKVTCNPHNCPPLILPDLFDTTGY